MRNTILLLLLSFSLLSRSQVITSTIVDDPKFLKHTRNWATREKIEYADEDNIIQIQNTGNNLVQTGYTARLNTEKHGLILHKFNGSGTEITINKLENGEREFGPVPTISLEFNNRILLLYFKFLDKDSMKLYLSEIDKQSLALVNTQPLFTYQQDNVGVFKMAKALSHQLITRQSPDSSKLLIAYQDPKRELFSCILNAQLNLIRNTVSKKTIPEEGDITDAFVENSGNCEFIVSLSGSTFSNSPLKGIIVQQLGNKEKYQEFGNGPEGNFQNAHFKNSRDNSRIYLFGDYAGAVGSAGVWLGELESDRFKISKPVSFSYPEDYIENVYNIGFGLKKRGSYGIMDVDYQLVEFENGTVALCGHPISRYDGTYIDNGKSGGYVQYFAGPIMVAFFEKNKKGKKFSMIPRNENMSLGSDGIYFPYQDKLVVFYNDYKKNINGELLQDKVHKSGSGIVHELSLAYAVINKSGAVEQRKLIAEGVSRMNCYNTSRYRFLSDKKISIPSVSMDKKSDAYKVALITIE